MDTIFDLGGAIGGIANAVSSVWTNKTNQQIAQDANAAQAEREKVARDWSELMWNKQNEYNDPKNQVARYEAAGLNPYAMMNQGSSMLSGNASSPAQNVSPVPQNVSYMENPRIGDSLMQGLQLKLQKKNLDNEIRKTDIEQYKADSQVQVNLQTIDNMVKEGVLTDAKAEETKANAQLLALKAKETEANIDLIGAKAANEAIDAYFRIDKNVAELAKLESEIFKNEAETKEARQRIQNLITDKELKETEIKINDEIVRFKKTEADFIQMDYSLVQDYKKSHLKGHELQADAWAAHFASGIQAATGAEVDRENAKTNKRNAATNERNAKTNERNADTNERNAETNRFRSFVDSFRTFRGY